MLSARGPYDRLPTVVRGDDLAAYHSYFSDESQLAGGTADAAAFPTDTGQVSAVLALASREGVPATVSGGRTGLVGGAVPMGGYLLSLERMNQIGPVTSDPLPCVRAGPGVSLRQLNERLAGQPWCFPVNPTEDSAQVGGMVATCASGSRSLKYGSVRSHVQGLTVVLPTGHVVDLQRGQVRSDGGVLTFDLAGRRVQVPVPRYPRPDVKNAAGYFSGEDIDAVDLFIGSEGTLGVITEVLFKLSPRPAGILTGLLMFPCEDDALALVHAIQGPTAAGVDPLTLEFFDQRSIELLRDHRLKRSGGGVDFPPHIGGAIEFEQEFEPDGLNRVYEAWMELGAGFGADIDRTVGGVDEVSAAPVKELRHALPEAVNALVAEHRRECPVVHKFAADMAVPAGGLDRFIDRIRRVFGATGMDHLMFGHIGQNHLHANVFPRTSEQLETGVQAISDLAATVLSWGGSVLVEHGGGRIKRRYVEMMYGDGVNEMRQVKRALDPAGVLNPGVLFE